jgi:exopolysaccharide biosynthesis WecB/TagA/CpsF family protein
LIQRKRRYTAAKGFAIGERAMTTKRMTYHNEAPGIWATTPPTRHGSNGESQAPGTASRRATRTRHEIAIRVFDACAAALTVVACAPVFLLQAVRSLAKTGRVFDRSTRVGKAGRAFEQRVFAAGGFGRRLPVLLDVLGGRMALAGPRVRGPGEARPTGAAAALRPGLVSPYDLRRRLGIAHRTEAEVEEAFAATRTLGACVTLVLRGLVARVIGGRERQVPPRFEILGVSIANGNMADTVSWLSERIKRRQQALVAFVNPDCLNSAFQQPAYRSVLGRADRVLPDGIGVHLACRMQGIALDSNLNGTDLFPVLCERLARDGHSVFLLGGRPGVAAAAAARVRERFPGLTIAGTHHGYFEAAEADDVVRTVNASGADVLLVGLGAPRQELWLDQHRSALHASVLMGVGGLFDFYSGRIPRAPMWLREIGMEWTWRLLQEPRRMWRRYLVGNPLFLWRVWREVRITHRAARRALVQPGPAGGARRRASLRRSTWRARPALSGSAKRLIDVVGAGLLLLALTPLLALIALAIRIESPGPVLFRQHRVGRGGRSFTMWKFRSMYIDAEARKAELLAQNEMTGGVLFKMRRDPRITRVGRFIRRASIDELPQLWNVLKGDMSLVGPRPAVAPEVAQYSLAQRERLDAVPGITCTWQVSGRSEIPFQQQAQMDIDYIYRASLRTDIDLLVRTVPAIVTGRGAY